MKSFFSLICLSIVFTLSDVNAQFTQTWSADYQHSTSTGFSNEGKKLVKDSGGNIYILADVTSDIDPTGVVTGSTYHYTVLKKYDDSGVLQATRNILVNNHIASGFNNIGAFGLEIDDNNFLYVGYSIYNTITNYNISVAKYDSDLVRQWVSNFNPSSLDEGVDLKVSPNGTIYGLVKSTNGSNVQYHLIKPDSSITSSIPFYSFDANLDVINSMLTDGTDEVFVTGYRWISGTKNALTACVKFSGTIRWKKTYNGGTIIRDDSGNKIVAGTNSNELYIVGTSDRGVPNLHDAMVLKYYKSNGRLDWYLFLDNNNGADAGLNIYAYNNISLYIGSVSGNQVILDRIAINTGAHTGRHVYEPLPSAPYSSINSVTLTDLEVSPNKNIYLSGSILATDLSGQNFSALYCAKFYPATGRFPITAAFSMDFELPAEGDFATNFSSIATLPSYTTNKFYVLADVFTNFSSHTSETVRLIAYDFPSPMKLSNSSNLSTNESLEIIRLFPSPAESSITIQTLQQLENIQIIDPTGKVIMTTTPAVGTELVLDVSMLPGGIYFLKTNSATGETYYNKFIKNQ